MIARLWRTLLPAFGWWRTTLALLLAALSLSVTVAQAQLRAIAEHAEPRHSATPGSGGPVSGVPTTGPAASGGFVREYPIQQAAPHELAQLVKQVLTGQNLSADVVADPNRPVLLVRGSQADHALAQKVIQSLDIPVTKRLPARRESELNSYRCPVGELANRTQYLQGRFGSLPGVRITPDQRTSQILVIAPGEVQSQIEALWQQSPANWPPAHSPLHRQSGSVTHTVPGHVPPRTTSQEKISQEPASQQPASQELVSQEVTSQEELTTTSPKGSDQQRPSGIADGSRQTVPLVGLQNVPGEEILNTLDQVWGTRARRLPRDKIGVVGREVAAQGGDQPMFVLFNPHTQEVALDGPEASVQPTLQFIRALDQDSQTPNEQIRVMTVRHARPLTVRQAVNAYQRGQTGPRVVPAGTQLGQQPARQETPRTELPRQPSFISRLFRPTDTELRNSGPTPPAADNTSLENPLPGNVLPGNVLPGNVLPGNAPGQPAPTLRIASQPRAAQPQTPSPTQPNGAVGNQPGNNQPGNNQPGNNQPGAGQPGTGQPGTGQPGTGRAGTGRAGQAPPSDLAGTGAPLGNVQLEFIEGLDAFVIRGSQRDVQQIVRLIEEIERLSQVTEPLIEIYQLRYVGSEQLAELLRQIYDEVLSPRQGRVSITELVKPNSLLLIGQAESVRTIIELIRRLDVPVSPATQFEVFRLKHASAQATQTTLEEFFAERQVLGTRVLITADFRTNSLLVQASPRDLAEVMLLLKRIDAPDSEAVNELRLIPLQNSLADQLAEVLQQAIGSAAGTAAPTVPGQQAGQQQPPRSSVLQFVTVDRIGQQKLISGVLTNVQVTADPRANALIVSAPAASIDLISQLVEQLDNIPAAEAQVKVFPILNGDALTLVNVVEELFASQTADGGLLNQQAGGLIEGETSLVPLRFSVDQRTNTIIAIGSLADLTVVEAILLRLDEEGIQERQTEVFKLRNAPALDVANTLQQYLTQQQQQVQAFDPNLTNPFELLAQQVVVVGEPVTNSLILSADPDVFEEIQAIIQEIDARPPMVVIQVLLADIALRGTDEFGIELGLQSSILFDRGVVGTDIIGPGYLFNPSGGSVLPNDFPASPSRIGAQALSSFAVGRSNSTLGYGGLVLALSSENISLLIRALQEVRRLEVLARPQVMTLDNQPAFVLVGERVPRIVGSTTNQNGTSFTTELENVGLILGVTPRITPENIVVMEIDAERSELGPEIEGIPISITPTGDVIRSPRIDTITAQTTVSALSGQTVILGGLITKSTSTVHRTVPLLGHLPVLKHLFRFDSVIKERTELLIVMTPYVIRNRFDSDIFLQQEAARMSWCLQDVEDLTSNYGLRTRFDHWPDHQTQVIYPGQSAEEIPAPQQRNAPEQRQPDASGTSEGPDADSYQQEDAGDQPTGPVLPTMNRPTMNRPTIHQPIIHQPIDHQPVDHQPVDHQPVDHRSQSN